jgi:hypothetical protein
MAEEDSGQRNAWVKRTAAAVAVLFAAWYLLSLVQPPGGARDFARVGGQSRIETSIEAARFWSTPGPVVLAPFHATPQNMLGAGARAAELNAPLLLTPRSGLPKALRNELERRTSGMRDGQSCIELFDPSLRRILPGNLKARIRSRCPAATDGAPTTVAQPVHLVALDDTSPLGPSDSPPQIRVWIRPQVPVQRCRANYVLERLRQQLLAKFWKVPPEHGKLPCPLPETVVFATAQKPFDLRDIAVATALAAHLSRTTAAQPVVVALPRYLEGEWHLERFLRDRGFTVSRGVVIGGPAAVSDDLRRLIRSVMPVPNAPALLQASSTLFEKLLLLVGLLLGVGAFGAAAGAVTEAAPGVGNRIAGVLTQTALRIGNAIASGYSAIRRRLGSEEHPAPGSTAGTGKEEGEPPMTATGTPEAAQDLDPTVSLQKAIDAVGAKDVWIRICLKEPFTWMVGRFRPSPDGQLSASPFPGSKALWLWEVRGCDPETGRFTDSPQHPGSLGPGSGPPQHRANAVAVRWEDVRIIEIVNSSILYPYGPPRDEFSEADR